VRMSKNMVSFTEPNPARVVIQQHEWDIHRGFRSLAAKLGVGDHFIPYRGAAQTNKAKTKNSPAWTNKGGSANATGRRTKDTVSVDAAKPPVAIFNSAMLTSWNMSPGSDANVSRRTSATSVPRSTTKTPLEPTSPGTSPFIRVPSQGPPQTSPPSVCEPEEEPSDNPPVDLALSTSEDSEEFFSHKVAYRNWDHSEEDEANNGDSGEEERAGSPPPNPPTPTRAAWHNRTSQEQGRIDAMIGGRLLDKGTLKKKRRTKKEMEEKEKKDSKDREKSRNLLQRWREESGERESEAEAEAEAEERRAGHSLPRGAGRC
jgi:hypothetical protein